MASEDPAVDLRLPESYPTPLLQRASGQGGGAILLCVMITGFLTGPTIRGLWGVVGVQVDFTGLAIIRLHRSLLQDRVRQRTP